MRRWSHGHSIGVGAALAWALAGYTPWLLLAGGFVLGLLAHSIRAGAERFLHWIAEEVAALRIDRAERQAGRIRELHARPKPSQAPDDDGVPY